MRDPHDVMTFFQTNMLCESFTDVNKFFLSEQDLLLEDRITQLYQDIENTIKEEECSTVEKLHQVILKGKTNYRQQCKLGDREPISVQNFIESIIGKTIEGNGNNTGGEAGGAMKLDYKREGGEASDGEEGPPDTVRKEKDNE